MKVRIVACAAAVLTVGALHGGLAGAGLLDEWTSLRRPLHMPKVKAGVRCPAAREAEVVGGQVLNGRDPVLLYGVGGAPAGVIALGYPDAKGWRGQKTPWLVPLTYQGPVLVRGARVDRPGPVRFGLEHRAELRYSSGQDTGTAAGRRMLASGSFFRSAGCYAFQVDGIPFSRVIVMRVVG
jgi:hypothetical protein